MKLRSQACRLVTSRYPSAAWGLGTPSVQYATFCVKNRRGYVHFAYVCKTKLWKDTQTTAVNFGQMKAFHYIPVCPIQKRKKLT